MPNHSTFNVKTEWNSGPLTSGFKSTAKKMLIHSGMVCVKHPFFLL